MGYAVRPDGSILVETLDEAIALSKKMANGSATNGMNGHAPMNSGGGEWATLLSLTKPNQRQVLALVKKGGAATLKEIAAALAVDTSSASGVLTALKRNVKKAGLAESSVIKRDSKGYGKNRVITYRAGAVLTAKEP